MDTMKLKGIIAENGLSQRKVAKAIGLTERTFYAKMKKGVFGTDEADKMIDLLHIKDAAAVFLSKK